MFQAEFGFSRSGTIAQFQQPKTVSPAIGFVTIYHHTFTKKDAFIKMKKILIYIFALLLAAPGWSREFFRLGGLKKVRIIKVTHRGILVSHTEGICNLDLKKLSAQDKKDLEKELLELQQKQQEQQSAIAADRRAQVGTGDRSERIRTYNFPQGRVTDHRIGLTLYKIDSILNGDLDEVVDALITAHRAEQLQQTENKY